MLGLLTPYLQRTNIYASTNTCIALNSEKTRYGKEIQNYGGISRLQKGTNDTFLNYYFTNLIKTLVKILKITVTLLLLEWYWHFMMHGGMTP